jgi:hypothetical protein
MNTQQPRPEAPLQEDPHGRLEKAFIEEYLRSQGYTLEDLHHLPEDVVKRLMTEASLYASVRLTEVEARARFVHEVEGATSS